MSVKIKNKIKKYLECSYRLLQGQIYLIEISTWICFKKIHDTNREATCDLTQNDP